MTENFSGSLVALVAFTLFWHYGRRWVRAGGYLQVGEAMVFSSAASVLAALAGPVLLSEAGPSEQAVSVSLAIAAVSFVVTLAVVEKRVWRASTQAVEERVGRKALHARGPLWALFAIWGAQIAYQVYAGVRFGRFVSGSATEALPYGLFVAQSILTFLTGGTLLWLGFEARSTRGILRAAVLAALLVSLSFALVRGRRDVLTCLILVVVGAATARPIRLRRAAVPAAVVVTALGAWFLLFPSLRQEYHRIVKAEGTFGALQLVATGASEAGGPTRSTSEIVASGRENIAQRLGFLSFVDSILLAQDGRLPMYGMAVASGALWVVPAWLFPGKADYFTDSETAVLRHFGLPPTDAPTTWLSTGCADFGAAGGLLGALVWIATALVIVRIAQQLAPIFPHASIFLLGALYSGAFTFEEDPSALFSTLRFALIALLTVPILKARIGRKTANPRRTRTARKPLAAQVEIRGRSSSCAE